MSELCALLLTDIADSTALSRRFGDDFMAELWEAHDRVARGLMRQWRGREIDKSDGFLLLFEGATDAAGYALAYHRALSALEVPLHARAGLHVGRVTLRENDPGDVALGAKPLEVDGLAKAVAARVMSTAQGGQTLVTAEAASTLARDAGARLQSHGHWRIKGLEQPIELFELGDVDSTFDPPPDGAKSYRVVRHNEGWLPRREVPHSLPAERDAFVGRLDTLRDLARRFEDGARLVSVLGTGGTGKTRLAQRYGWNGLGDYPGGVWFCDLSQVRSLDGIGDGVAKGLRVPLGQADPVAQIGDVLAGRGDCLMILDNFEQVRGYAEQTVGRWLDRAVAARFVVTSREVLGITGEEVLTLTPLEPAEASALFLRRAEAAQRGFRPTQADAAAVEPLVKLLDGLPLAIELAAARVSVMAPHVLLKRMSERFTLLTSKGGRGDRQATLRATFDWSWEMLSLPEKAALAQLSTFEGGFTLAAVEATLDLHPQNGLAPPVDLLQSLVEKSLVRHRADGRFDLLVSVRDYAGEHLRTEGRYAGSGPQARLAAQRRHWGYYSALDEEAAVADACAELDNLVLACRQAVLHGDAANAVGALEGAWAALRLRGPFRVGSELAGLVRAMPGLEPRWCARIDCLNGSALRACGRVAEARAGFEAALAAARDAQDRVTERRVLCQLGVIHADAGRIDDGRALLIAALQMAREAGDPGVECEALAGIGSLCEHHGSMSDARAHYEASLGVARAAGNRRWEGGSLGNLGLLCANEGNMGEARAYYEAGLAVARELGDRQWEGNTLCNLGELHQVQGRLPEARACLDGALAVARELGYVKLGAVVMCNLGIVHEAMQSPAEARVQFESALAVARKLADRRFEGQFLNYLGALNARQGRFVEAWNCLDAGERLLTEVSDLLNLGVLLCSRSEAHHLAGDPAAGRQALERAAALAREVDAKAESELGVALQRVSAILNDAMPG